jgi:pimeloyl-ACP methyl ester carboxylesterase
MKQSMSKLSTAVLLIFCSISLYFPAFAQSSGGAEANSGNELTVSVSIVSPNANDELLRTALKPNDQFSVHVDAPGMGITDVSINFDELGIGIEPLADTLDGMFASRVHWLPFRSDGIKHYTVIFKDSLGNQHSITKTVVVDTTPPGGLLTATFTNAPSSLLLHVSGTIDGTGSNVRVTGASIYGIDQTGARIPGEILTNPTTILDTQSSPLTADISVRMPEASWAAIGYAITLQDGSGNESQINSEPTSVASIQAHPRINHAIGGSIIQPVDHIVYDLDGGIGIPHTLINSLPEGDYYAVVFFEGLIGCPTTNYEINSFYHELWGYDIRGEQGVYSMAHSSTAGGCMQEFHVDPKKGDPWMWGALSNTGTSSAIADRDGVPAFAICDTAAACDSIAPFITSGPDTSTSTPPGRISNVMFLPGIKGSKLYENNPLCFGLFDACDIPLWIPLLDLSVPELFMDAAGKSNRRVFTKEGDIVSSAFGQNFYDALVQKMNNAQSEGTYGKNWQWKPIAYDWRMSLQDIVNNGAQFGQRIYYEDATSTPYIEQSLRALAASSPTGKVTLLAHSNGGLVAKALLQKLGDSEAAKLVDSVIMVGVPQSGAPRALGSALYGDSESIPSTGRLANLVMSARHAREFALTAPVAYHLLPSARYTKQKNETHPLIKFEDGSLLSNERALYGETIDSPEELHSYLLDDQHIRSMPATSDLTAPNILHESLATYAEDIHTSLDNWVPPAGIQVYEVAGYGVDTLSGIAMYESPTKGGGKKVLYRPLFTQDGDGTVPIISSLMMNVAERVHTVWTDLSYLATGHGYSHGDIFEAPEIEASVENILRTPAQSVATVASQMTVPQPPSASHKRITFYVHSPVTLSVTDSAGAQTVVREEGSSQDDIADSESGIFGDVKYVSVPADAQYSVKLTGTDEGIFTLDLEDRTGSAVTSSSTIADVPTTTKTTASLTVSGSITNTSPLSVDVDGDGSEDYLITPKLGETVFPSDPIKKMGDAAVSTTTTSTYHYQTQTYSVPSAKKVVTPLLKTATSTQSIASTSPSSFSLNVSTTTSESNVTFVHGTTHTRTQVLGTSTDLQAPTTQAALHSSVSKTWWGRIVAFARHVWHFIVH